MPNFRTLAAALALTHVGFLDTGLRAQNVILSEIAVAGTDRWIEVQNRSAVAADVSAWSIYLATTTPGRPQTYWWGFPAGTVLQPGAFLRVHWYQPAPATVLPDELWTGNTIYNFLFGLGGEALPTNTGAIGLLRTQANSLMNTPAIFADFVQYGGTGLARESVAAQAGVWVAGRSVTAPLAGQSLARNPALIGLAAPDAQWLIDETPTPGASNVGAASVAPVGAPCAVLGNHLLGAPQLLAQSTPLLGNGSFSLQLTNTTGVMLENCLLAFSLRVGATGMPALLPTVAGGGCDLYVDPATTLGSVWAHTNMGATTIPLPLPLSPANLAGMTFGVQAIVFDLWQSAWPLYQGASNALAITLGN